MRDTNLNSAQDNEPQKVTATITGAGADLAGYDGALIEFNFGAITDGTHTPSVEDSPDNSTWTAVDASLLVGSLTEVTSSSGGGAVQSVGYIGGQRYVRSVVTVAGATDGGIYGSTIVRGFPSVS